jgi:hypothetical protein
MLIVTGFVMRQSVPSLFDVLLFSWTFLVSMALAYGVYFLTMTSVLFVDRLNNIAHLFEQKERETEIKKRCDYVDVAFGDFDKLADCFNLIFEQFNVNVILTRDGLIPRQDPKIVKDLYLPILKILADPKWKSVSEDLASMFEAYLSKNFAESITKAHVVMQRFLQILLGREEGKNAKGEMKDLFHSLKEKSHIPFTKLGESITKALSDFMSSQRALISTAKPSMQNADRSDALVTMNVLMVYLQHCLTITYVPQ